MMKMLPFGTVGDWVRLLRINKPVGYWLLLWPTLWGLLAASHGRPEPKNLLVFVAGVLLMRSAGCVINDFADREFDPHVSRTRDRPIAAGSIAPGAALTGLILMLFTAFLLVAQTSPLVMELAVVGVFLAVIYPFLKRYTHFPQAWLGMAFGWGAVMGWAAENGSVMNSPVPWLLFAANIFWSLSYDTAYAIGDRADDAEIGVKSTALWFGDKAVMAIVGLAVAMLAMLAIACWQYGGRSWLGWTMAACWQTYLMVRLLSDGEIWSFPFFLKSHWTGMFFCLSFIIS